MKNKKIYAILLLLFLSIFLSACSGRAMVTNSWPGLRADQADETVYVANNTFVYALNLSNGTEKWRYPAEGNNKVVFYAPPAVASDGQVLLPSYDASLYSINPETRAVNWTFSGAKNRYIDAVLVFGNQILAANSDNSLYSVGLDGQLQWVFETKHSLWATPVTDGEAIYLTSMDHHVYALRSSDGGLIWQTEDLGGALAAHPVLGENGMLYVGSFGSEVIALDTQKQGQVVWKVPMNGWVWSTGLLKEDTLYVGDLGGSLFALEASTGKEKWRFAPSDIQKPAIAGAPAFIGDTLFYVTEGGNLYALDWVNGAQRWTKQFETSFYPGPIVVGDMLLLAPMGGDELVIALDGSGNQKWTFIPTK